MGWNLRGLSVISFAHGLSDFFSGLVPFAIFLAVSHAHMSAAYQGGLVFLWYVTSSIVQPLFGAYSDRSGRWWFLPAAIAVTVVAVSLAGTATSLPLLAACIIAGGLGSAVMHPEAGKYSAMLSGARKATGISIFQIGGQIGYSIGPVAIALLYARFGTAGSLLLMLPGLAGVAVLFALMRGVDRSAVHLHGRAAAQMPASGPVDRFGVALLVFGTAMRHFASAGFMTYLPNLLVGRGMTIPVAGEIVSAFLIVSSFGLYFGGTLSDRFGPVRISMLAMCGAVPFLWGFFTLPGALAVASLLAGSVMLAVQNAPGVALVQAMLPKNLGMALGLMNGVAFGIGSALVAFAGIAVAQFGATSALEAVGTTPLLGALSYAFVALRLPARRRAAAA
jgi:FSR family fosmidomycin resistance protein-like MFS transporter